MLNITPGDGPILATEPLLNKLHVTTIRRCYIPIIDGPGLVISKNIFFVYYKWAIILRIKQLQ